MNAPPNILSQKHWVSTKIDPDLLSKKHQDGRQEIILPKGTTRMEPLVITKFCK